MSRISFLYKLIHAEQHSFVMKHPEINYCTESEQHHLSSLIKKKGKIKCHRARSCQILCEEQHHLSLIKKKNQMLSSMLMPNVLREAN